ncbi:hypothetical protein D3Z48_12225 [Clostridiaceae bacterium]|nr:hypothetical protein [Clostridiaceae bacterium]
MKANAVRRGDATQAVPRPARRRDKAFTQFFLEKIAGFRGRAPDAPEQGRVQGRALPLPAQGQERKRLLN